MVSACAHRCALLEQDARLHTSIAEQRDSWGNEVGAGGSCSRAAHCLGQLGKERARLQRFESMKHTPPGIDWGE